MDSRKNTNTFNELAQIMNQVTVPPAQQNTPSVQQPQDPNESLSSADTEPVSSAFAEVTNPETGEILQILPEFAELYNMNNHIVGWIQIDGTDINYPVIQTPDMTNYYLYKGYDREYSRLVMVVKRID